MGRFTGILGLLTMLGLAYLMSSNRRAIRLKTVLWGLSLQILFAFFVLRFQTGQKIFSVAGDAVKRLLDYSYAGSEFVFGPLGMKSSTVVVDGIPLGKAFFFAFQVLPTIIFIAAFFALLYYLGVMQIIIRARGVGDAAHHGSERRRIAERRRQYFHGADGSSADHSSVSA